MAVLSPRYVYLGDKRHPVAALLTAEMRERVRAATFKRTRDGRIAAKAPNGRNVCPLGIALDMRVSQPRMDDLFDAFDIQYVRAGSGGNWARQAVRDFTYLADFAKFEPADVYVLLGCEDRP